jgi:hypothetical protein
VSPNFASIDVSAFGAVVADMETTLAGLETISALAEDFAFFGVDTTNLNKLIEAQRDLVTVVPDLRRRHELAVQLLSEQPANLRNQSDVVRFEGDLLDDPDLNHRADVTASITALEEAGLLDEPPSEDCRAWVSATLLAGLTPGEIVERARQEGVTATTFDPLTGVEYFTDPDGRRYYVITDSETAEEIGRLTELINGGEPSLTDDRRDANSWTYDEDVDLVLDSGGAIVASPQGILMAAPGPETPVKLGNLPIVVDIPNPAELLSFSGGTAWGDMYVINGSFDSDPTPEEVLRAAVESNDPPPGSGAPSLDRLLRHESVHSQQWADLGHPGFLVAYFAEFVDWRWSPWPPFWVPDVHGDPCRNHFEEEAGFEDGGYRCQ